MNLFLRLYREGRIAGIKPEEAFFVKIGSQTMTTLEISQNRKILIAGYALIKPAEFDIIRIERLATVK